MQGDEGFEARLLVYGAVVLAEEVVEKLRGGPGGDAHHVHEHEDDGRHPGANGQSVADAYRLGHDFTEDDNEDGGANNGRPASTQRAVEDNGQRLVGDDVAEEERHQDPVLAALQQSQNAGGVVALVRLARLGEDLEIDFVLAHEAVVC